MVIYQKKTLKKTLDYIDNKRTLKEFKTELKDLVKIYPKLVEKGKVSNKNDALIDWIENVVLFKLIPKKRKNV